MVKCVVSGCPNRRLSGENRSFFNRPPKRFFQFPKDPARVKVWLAALREAEQQEPAEQRFICEDHFLPEDICRNQVSSEAIPIMPPCVGGGLGVAGPWGGVAEEEEEEDAWTMDADEEGEEEAAPAAAEAPPSGQEAASPQTSAAATAARRPPPTAEQTPDSRATQQGVSAAQRLRRFLELMLASPDHLLDVRRLAAGADGGGGRVDDITGVLEEIRLIQKQSAHSFKWIGRSHICSFLWRSQQDFQAEMEKLRLVEGVLDGLIKSCSQQLFEVTDNLENAALAYVSLADIGRLEDFQQQTVLVVKAPEETKLEVPAPKEDSIQVHLKAEQGPILVLTCDLSGGEDTYSCFLTLEESRVRTAQLHTGQ